MANRIVVYTHPDCSYSAALQGELDEAETEYDAIDLSLNPEEWATVEKLTDGERITPVMVEGDQVTVGFHGVG